MNQTIPIHVQNLYKNFGKVKALKGVSLKIENGQIFGLLGPNGAGKTTLIRLLIGSTKPSSGHLSVLGFDPTKQKRAIRKLIGYMPQYPALYEDLSPHENIHFFGISPSGYALGCESVCHLHRSVCHKSNRLDPRPDSRSGVP